MLLVAFASSGVYFVRCVIDSTWDLSIEARLHIWFLSAKYVGLQCDSLPFIYADA